MKILTNLTKRRLYSKINKYWRNTLLVGHNLKDKMEGLQIRFDEVLCIRDIYGTKVIVNNTRNIDGSWIEVNKLNSIYYNVTGKVMKKSRTLDDIRAVKESYDTIQGEWIDHCGPTAKNMDAQLSGTSNDNILR